MRKRLSFHHLQLLISLVLVSFFIYSLDLREKIHPLTPMGWLYLGVVALLANADRLVMAYKWNILLRAKGVMLSLFDVVRSYYIGTFWGLFLPASVGGDVVRGYQVAAQTNRGKDITSSIMVERLLGALATLLIGTAGAAVFVTTISPSHWKLLSALAGMLLLLSLLVVLSFNVGITRWLGRFLPESTRLSKENFGRLYESYRSYVNCPSPLSRFLALSVLEQCIPILCVFLASQALELRVSFWSSVMFVPIILVSSRMPLGFDGFGVREGLYVYFFSRVGVAGSEAFILGFVSHVTAVLGVLPAFYYFASHSPTPATSRISLPS
jgi:glycosyltransferase 2 family protein